MTIAANLGFPRIGRRRELKRALEDHWAGRADAAALEEAARALRRSHWLLQRDLGLAHIPCNDFSLYDHVLDAAVMADAVPARFAEEPSALARYFAMARGSRRAPALEMTKWLDTNYHHLVPEYTRDQTFRLGWNKPLEDYGEARALGLRPRPVLLGPASLLRLGKPADGDFDPLELLDRLLPVYEQVLDGLADAGADWVQIDEPVLAMDADRPLRAAVERALAALARPALRRRTLLTCATGGWGDLLEWALRLPVHGLHLDLVRAPGQLDRALAAAPRALSLSLGLIDGRNVWRADLDAAAAAARKAARLIGPESLMVSPSCSLLHVPMDLSGETALDPVLKDGMAFAVQKIEEVTAVARAVDGGPGGAREALEAARAARARLDADPRRSVPAVRAALARVTPEGERRPALFAARRAAQRARLPLPPFPTTTIGSFPQTEAVRRARADARAGRLSPAAYEAFLKDETARCLREQEALGLDVLVHGEFERNDMVEHFGERLEGFAFTANGWVQSYGSRCVKPPVLFGDVRRPGPMTVDWFRYAQSLTEKPVKGMLTGPVTILSWSFVRDDRPREQTCRQIALAVREEVADLEATGAAVIQVDEPALREGLPLRAAARAEYLAWAVGAFRLATGAARAETQVHTHMCYADFEQILEAVAAMDADVISLEASRSGMTLLEAFRREGYPNDVGPGLFDIHSPRIPPREEMEALLRRAAGAVPPERLWVNPDCGLKTRTWDEVRPALRNLVAAARAMREKATAAR